MNWTTDEMERLFHPRSVAVVGDNKKRGYLWLRSLSTFQGPVYSVQVNPEAAAEIEAMGVPNYHSLLDVPGPVDYVIVSVPRQAALSVLQDCIAKRVEGVTFFTSGFAETQTDEGVRLGEEITRVAREGRMKVIGPNCLGIFNPKIGLRHFPDQYHGRSGPVGFISQSGTHADFFSMVGESHGILISKSVSFGNGIVLDCTDFLEYLGQERETGVIAMYLEGVRDGRRLFRVLRDVCLRKPTVVWKGGQTAEGACAAASHTAVLATSAAVWGALMRQCGAIPVDGMEELLDTVKALLYIRPATGRRMGIVSMTGGQSVVFTDTFVRAGLSVPALTQRTYQKYASFFDTVGGSYRNPLDISNNSTTPERIQRILSVLGEDPSVDAVAYELNLGFLLGLPRFGPQFVEALVPMLGEIRAALAKPFFVILTAGHKEREAVEVRRALIQRSVAVFATSSGAARAYRNLVDYYTFRQEAAAEKATS